MLSSGLVMGAGRVTVPAIGAIITLMLGVEGSAAADPNVAVNDIDPLVANLRANEELYANLEVRWVYSYHNRNAHAAKDEHGNVPYHALEKEEVKGWSVQQDGKFFLDCRGVSNGPADDPYETPIQARRGYDGNKTRLVELAHSNVGNVVAGPAYDGRIFEPHTIPLRRNNIGVPLSVYMRGRAAILANPRADPTRLGATEIRTRYEGEEGLAGLKCKRVVIEYVARGRGGVPVLSDKRVMWLAVDRNYLPVKTAGFNLFYSKESPIEECVLDDLREIGPGIWFPFRSTLTVMDQIELLERKKAVLSANAEYVVASVSLNPQFETAFFRDVPFPDGTVVYEIAQDKRISKGYVIGDKTVGSSGLKQSSKLGIHWLVIANAAAIFLLVGWIVVRRLRWRQ